MIPESLQLDLKLIESQLKNDVTQLKNKRLFITGATGFVGKWLLLGLSFLNEKHQLNLEIVALSRDPKTFKKRYPLIAKGITFLKGDIKDFESEAGSFDYVIHGAVTAQRKFVQDNPLETFETIIAGAKRVSKFARDSKVSRILNISSGAAYGAVRPEVNQIEESYSGSFSLQDPFSAYGEGKRMSEFLFNMEAQNFMVAHARCFSFGGVFLDHSYAFSGFLEQVLNGEAIVVKNRFTLRSYLYASDMVIWLLTILLRGKNQETYNVGSDQVVSVGQLAQLATDLGDGPEVCFDESLQHNQTTGSYIPSIKKAQEELGLKVFTELPVMLKHVFEQKKWLKNLNKNKEEK